MHDRGVIHRDLKPANILLAIQPSGSPSPYCVELNGVWLTPSISDFGIAQVRGRYPDLTGAADRLGTPHYMAPEQETNVASATNRADIHALGAIFYELLTGQLPVRDKNGELQSPRSLHHEVPKDLDTLCMKCLECAPGQRLESAGLLAAELERWLRGEPIQTRPISLAERGWRFASKRPVITLLATALALSVLTGGTGILYQLREAQQARQQAEANNRQTQMLIAELLPTSPAAPRTLRVTQRIPKLEAMIQNEAHLSQMMDRGFGDAQTRVALTHLRGSIGLLQGLQGNSAEADRWLAAARELWPAEPRTAQEREWIATTLYWQSRHHLIQGRQPEWLTKLLEAHTLYLERLQQQADDGSLWQPVLETNSELTLLRHTGAQAKRFLQVLQEHQDRRAGCTENTDFHALIEQSTLLYAQGEVHRSISTLDKAQSCWLEARRLARSALEQRPDHLLALLCLARINTRLSGLKATAAENAESLRVVAQLGDRLDTLQREHPSLRWLFDIQTECRCIHAVLLWWMGQSEQAERALDQLDDLLSQPDHATHPRGGFRVLGSLLEAISHFENKEHPAVRRLAIRAARWAEIMLDHPQRDLDHCEMLAVDLMSVSGYLRRTGELRDSLQLAEQSRRLLTALHHSSPQIMNYTLRLSEAWERVAKSRWELGERSTALAALKESYRYQQKASHLGGDPAVTRHRESRCLDRLYHFGLLAGDHVLVAQALRARAKLWTGDRSRQQEVVEDFQPLIDSLAADHPERASYLAESLRIRQALMLPASVNTAE
jgi:hypothetical protein